MKKLNPEVVKDDYERFRIIRKTKIDKRFYASIILKRRGRTPKNKHSI